MHSAPGLDRLRVSGLPPHQAGDPTAFVVTSTCSDPFFCFWFRSVARNRSRLERGHVDEELGEVTADLDNLIGQTFEDCCRHWVGHHARVELVGRSEQLGSWWSCDGRVEIDIVGVRRHRYERLGSCT